MAAAWTRHLAGDRVEVYSGGSAPAASVNPAAVEAMREVGIEIADAVPKLFDVETVKAADVVITMGCGDECPLVLAERRVDWKIPDPRDMTPEQFRGVRDLIESKVKELIGELSTA